MSMVLSFIGKSKPKMQLFGQEYSIPQAKGTNEKPKFTQLLTSLLFLFLNS